MLQYLDQKIWDAFVENTPNDMVDVLPNLNSYYIDKTCLPVTDSIVRHVSYVESLISSK